MTVPVKAHSAQSSGGRHANARYLNLCLGSFLPIFIVSFVREGGWKGITSRRMKSFLA